MIKKYPLYYNLDTCGGADVSGVTATAGDVDTGKVFVNSSGTEVTGTSTYKADYTALNTLISGTTAAAEDVAQGKVFVNSSGVQTTGTASGGGDEDFIKLIEGTPQATITFPNGTTKIGAGVFASNKNLSLINIPDTVTFIDASAFSLCSNLTVYFGNNSTLEEISDYAFNKCSNLSLTSLPNSVTYIRTGAFQDCSNLALTSLPNSVTRILESAFNNCVNVRISQIPNGVTFIGNYSFFACTSLTEITFLGTPTTIFSTAFHSCTNLTTIRVPWSSGAVSGAPWGATNASIVYNYTP